MQYEQDPSIRQRKVKAVELFSLLMQERASTGEFIFKNVDHCNTYSPFNPSCRTDTPIEPLLRNCFANRFSLAHFL
ncbi:hypothetical protein INT82_09445 [Mannheimia haemolytica]|nr:hypothetical protein [Mannheimia haemolytica]